MKLGKQTELLKALPKGAGVYSMCDETYRWARVRQVTALSPRQVQAPDKLQVKRVRGVEHGEAHDVGLVIHDVVESQQREVLQGGREDRRANESWQFYFSA